ncbi:MAG: hypothetical protein HC771_19300 [Synechococcales cyanobacterium CRU_2_2]|nr:hypothetical protein [Synechococcales cyanobacterium CRU_2_2]
MIKPFVEGGEGIAGEGFAAEGWEGDCALALGRGDDASGKVVEKTDFVFGAGGWALKVDEEGNDAIGEKASEVEEEGGFAHAALAVEEERRAAAI